jgi:hypothetical protein
MTLAEINILDAATVALLPPDQRRNEGTSVIERMRVAARMKVA